METSYNGIRMIKTLEGLATRAYRCPAGVLTIGYGHTGNVREGQICTEAEAEVWLKEDIRKAEKSVNVIQASRQLRQNEYDALVSFAYNVGVSAFEKSTLYRVVKTNPDDSDIQTQFMRWIYAGGKKIPGLVARRKREVEMYFRR